MIFNHTLQTLPKSRTGGARGVVSIASVKFLLGTRGARGPRPTQTKFRAYRSEVQCNLTFILDPNRPYLSPGWRRPRARATRAVARVGAGASASGEDRGGGSGGGSAGGAPRGGGMRGPSPGRPPQDPPLSPPPPSSLPRHPRAPGGGRRGARGRAAPAGAPPRPATRARWVTPARGTKGHVRLCNGGRIRRRQTGADFREADPRCLEEPLCGLPFKGHALFD